MAHQAEIALDKQRIDSAIERLESVMDLGDPQAIILAARALVPLLERRSKLLGLDASPDDKQGHSAAESPVERIRRLAAVPSVPSVPSAPKATGGT